MNPWKRLMGEWARQWFSEVSDRFAVEARPQTWRYGSHYAEIRRVINASTARKYPDSEALNAAIRCRNRSFCRPAFDSSKSSGTGRGSK